MSAAKARKYLLAAELVLTDDRFWKQFQMNLFYLAIEDRKGNTVVLRLTRKQATTALCMMAAMVKTGDWK